MYWYDKAEDDGFKAFLRDLVKLNRLESAELGITKQVITDGIESLSEKQRFVFHEGVMCVFAREECSRGGCPIPWSEMIDACDRMWMCGSCLHQYGKDNPSL